jgi:hypothetical protein
MNKGASNLIAFGIFTLIGVILAGSVFIISENMKEESNKVLIRDFSENILLMAENKVSEISKLVNNSNKNKEFYIEMKERIPGRVGSNTYTLLGLNDTLVFKSNDYLLENDREISFSNFNASGLCFSGNKEIIFVYNSSKKEGVVFLY